MTVTTGADVALVRRALDVARGAMATGDVPVGAVLVDAGGVELAAACNAREATGDPTAHAEMLALRAGSARLGAGWRLSGCTLAVTVEPCTMCAGAVVNAVGIRNKQPRPQEAELGEKEPVSATPA